MDQIEQQEECHQQNIKRDDSWKNQMKYLSGKFPGMDKKLNTLTNLIPDLSAQPREGKHKYEKES